MSRHQSGRAHMYQTCGVVGHQSGSHLRAAGVLEADEQDFGHILGYRPPQPALGRVTDRQRTGPPRSSDAHAPGRCAVTRCRTRKHSVPPSVETPPLRTWRPSQLRYGRARYAASAARVGRGVRRDSAVRPTHSQTSRTGSFDTSGLEAVVGLVKRFRNARDT